MTNLDWQHRVVEEKCVLDEKAHKLAEFINTNAYDELDLQNRLLLGAQLATMMEYSKILGERIKLFDVETKSE